MLKRLAARLLRRVFEIQAEVARKSSSQLLMEALREDARKDTVAFIRTEIPDAVWFEDKFAMMRYAFRDPGQGMILEFGVWKGHTVNFLASLTERPIYGFDSFEGLPQPWKGFKHVDFDLHAELPEVDGKVELIAGWFDVTLPGFLAAHEGPVAFLHLDCDLYESTRTVLELLRDRIVSGSYIEFDDYFCFPGWREHSHRAFVEFLAETGMSAAYIGFSGDQVLVRIR